MVKNYNLNVTEILDPDFKNVFPGIFNFTIGTLVSDVGDGFKLCDIIYVTKFWVTNMTITPFMVHYHRLVREILTGLDIQFRNIGHTVVSDHVGSSIFDQNL